MSLFDDIKTYLPKYLSEEATEGLFSELREFPKNIDQRIYTDQLVDDDNTFQGDGLAKLFIASLPDGRIGEGPVMVLSNTCDVTPEAKRWLSPTIVYCPIIKLAKYLDLITTERLKTELRDVQAHIDAIKGQRVSSMFYLPANGRLNEDCIALLDRPNNCDMSYLAASAENRATLFSLSNYGFYLFLVKLSIHFTRVREGIDRK